MLWTLEKRRSTALRPRWQSGKLSLVCCIQMPWRSSNSYFRAGSAKKSLAKEQSKPSVEVERKQRRKELTTLCTKRIKLVQDYKVSRSVNSYIRFRLNDRTQTHIRDAISLQTENARLAMQMAQVASNKSALEALCAVKDASFKKAEAKWQKRKCIS